MLRIAAFASLGGVSSKVLRDYDELGLVRPAWVDRHTGYRLYSPAQLPQLRRILALRELGVSLAEVRSLLLDGADLRSVLERRRAALEQARRDADRRLASLGISLAAEGDEPGLDIVVRDLAPELVAALDAESVGGDVGRAFYELELAIRDAGVRANRPPGALVRGPGDGPDVADTEVFVPIRRQAPRLSVRHLPPVRAVTLLHEGGYEGLPDTRARLDRWIATAGLLSSGPLRILYLQFGAEEDLRLPRHYLVERASQLVTELQLPVAA